MDVKSKWILAFAYVGFIYATLSVVPAPMAYLRAHNVLRVTIVSLFLVCLSITFVIMIFRTHKLWRFLSLFVLAALYGWLTTLVKRPEEQIHFIQYGLVGVLFARALVPRWGDGWRSFAAALALAIVAGTIDENIQGHLPNRHYDLHDIGLDAVSALLGLVVFRLIPPAPTRADLGSQSPTY
jgi:VanZ family protein